MGGLGLMGCFSLVVGLWSIEYGMLNTIVLQIVLMAFQMICMLSWMPQLRPSTFQDTKSALFHHVIWIAIGCTILLTRSSAFQTPPTPSARAKSSPRAKYARIWCQVVGGQYMFLGVWGLLHSPSQANVILNIPFSSVTVLQQFYMDMRSIVALVLGVFIFLMSHAVKWTPQQGVIISYCAWGAILAGVMLAGAQHETHGRTLAQTALGLFNIAATISGLFIGFGAKA
jgi:hypothetical protein